VLAGKLDSEEVEEVWLDACNASFTTMIRDKQKREAQEAKATVRPLSCMPSPLAALCSIDGVPTYIWEPTVGQAAVQCYLHQHEQWQ
jgi:hypothetical protein